MTTMRTLIFVRERKFFNGIRAALHFGARAEILRDRTRVLLNNFRLWQYNFVTRIQRPEPLIDLNTLAVLTVHFEVVEWLLVRESLPEVVLPDVGYDTTIHHR